MRFPETWQHKREGYTKVKQTFPQRRKPPLKMVGKYFSLGLKPTSHFKQGRHFLSFSRKADIGRVVCEIPSASHFAWFPLLEQPMQSLNISSQAHTTSQSLFSLQRMTKCHSIVVYFIYYFFYIYFWGRAYCGGQRTICREPVFSFPTQPLNDSHLELKYADKWNIQKNVTKIPRFYVVVKFSCWWLILP